MTETTTAIVVVAYNRPKSLSRILKSIGRANYNTKNIPLVVSIDFSDSNQKVVEVAENFKWEYGSKEIISHKENLGLRSHVIKCGDLTAKFDAIIMLEDDLFVSPNFYKYSLSALQFSKNNPKIAGISLYDHPLNVHTKDVFRPLEDGFDNYYFQFASSWGQAWNKDQWDIFKLWYASNQNLTSDPKIPQNVINWSDKSWLKYFTIYLIKKNKYFLYPKISLSTNFSDAGTHVGSDSTAYQTPLNFKINESYSFSSLEASKSIYDAFYENTLLHESIHLQVADLSIDLYGYKSKNNSRYWLTNRVADYKILKSYGCSLKPHDANIICDIEGTDFFLYDTLTADQNTHSINNFRKVIYNIRYISFKNALLVATKLLTDKIKAKFGWS